MSEDKNKKMGSKTKRLHDELVKLLDGKKSLLEISLIVGLSEGALRKYSKKHRLSYASNKRIPVTVISDSGKEYTIRFKKNAKLELKVINLAEQGMSYIDMSKKLRVSERKLLTIAHKHDIRRNKKFDTPENRALVKLINKDIDAGLPYEDLIKKHKLTLKFRGKLSALGLNPITKKYKARRDKEIAEQYKEKIAKKVLASEKEVLDSPWRITTEHNIYTISSEQGFKKYPQIIDRNKGGCFEDRKIIAYIFRKKDKDEWSFHKIADKLNKLGKRTVTGKKFAYYTVMYKYKHNKKLRNKKKPF